MAEPEIATATNVAAKLSIIVPTYNKYSWGYELATHLTREALGVSVLDPMSGYFMVRRKQFKAVVPKLSKEGFKIVLDFITSPANLKIVETPFQFHQKRMEGASKLGSLVTFDYLGLLLSKIRRHSTGCFVLFAMVGVFGHLCTLQTSLDMGVKFEVA